jgi:hypothetical protein
MLIFLVIPLLFVLFQNLSSEKNILLNILKSILIFSFITFSITEFSSLINQLNLHGLIISWLVVFFILIFLIFKTKSKIAKYNLLKIINTFSKSEKIYLTIIGLLFLLLFYQGIIYPPNNWDSLTYHMSRIMYWLGNENLNHFPTHILRHLYQPPFAEYLIMNVNVLQGNDYFSNSIQLFFLFFTLISINEILKWLEIKRLIRIVAFLFCLSIPSVVLQATSSKNDIICAYFVITAILFLIKCYEKPKTINFVFLGLSIGLGMLTKGTFYIFIFPALLFFVLLFFLKILKQKTYRKILLGIISVFFIFIINVGHFSRNYKVNQHILNIDDTEHKMYSNEDMNVKFFISNLLKNIGLHMGYPLTDNYNVVLDGFHEKYNTSIDNPKLNFLGLKYTSPKKFETHEDLVPNTFHFVLLLSVCLFLLFNSVYKKNYKILLLLCNVLLQIILFTIYLKWQPWHTRLHIPLFILSSVFIGFFFNLFKKPYLSYLISFGFLYSFWFYYVHNNIRPIITNRLYTKNIFTDDTRFKKYFANQMFLYPEYANVLNKMYEYNPKKVGLEIYDWEYPILAEYYYDHLKVVSINVANITNKIKQNINNIDVIISNKNNGNEYVFNGKTYINKTPENKHIWIYE